MFGSLVVRVGESGCWFEKFLKRSTLDVEKYSFIF
jgi:hypothetical protein